MNDDQAQTSNLTLDAPPEAITELDPLIDRGEATEVLPEPLTEPEMAVENAKKIEAMYKASNNIVHLMVELKVVSQDTVDNFQLDDSSPKIQTLRAEYAKVTQEIADKQDSDADVQAQSALQAELVISYQYAVAALVQKEFKPYMYKAILDASRKLRILDDTSATINKAEFDRTFAGMGRMASFIEEFQTVADEHIPKLVEDEKFPDLMVSCDTKNDQLMKFLTRDNQFKRRSEQSGRELGRFIDSELKAIISLTRIHDIQNKLEKLFNEKRAELQQPTATSDVAPNWTESSTTPNLGGWVTNKTTVAQEPVASDQTNTAGGWLSPDTTQSGQQVTYEAQLDAQKPGDDAAVEDNLDELIAVSQAQNKQHNN